MGSREIFFGQFNHKTYNQMKTSMRKYLTRMFGLNKDQPIEKPPRENRASQGHLLAEELRAVLGSEYRVFFVSKPFIRVTKDGSYAIVDIFPNHNTARERLVVKSHSYTDDGDLINFIKGVYGDSDNRGSRGIGGPTGSISD